MVSTEARSGRAGRTLLVVTCLALAVACSGSSGGHSSGNTAATTAATSGATSSAAASGELPLPSDRWRPGQPAMQALTSGTLILESHDAYACGWIGSRQSAYLWPEGYRVRVADKALLDGAGNVVAHAGDHVQAGGGGHEAASPGPCNRAGQWVFSVESQVRVEGHGGG